MPDIFISYSRRNKEFVKQLHQSLVENGRDVWVDWEDIPITADWWQEIRTGIDASDVVVFIISQASLESAVCTMEVAHALRQHKHFIPLVVSEPDEVQAFATIAAQSGDTAFDDMLQGDDLLMISRRNWGTISRHNWLFFRDDFTVDFAKLQSAIDIDLDYVRMHTRLLMRASEWQNAKLESSFLLDGLEIVEAEKWLAESGNKEPKPTELHTEFILASRALERQRQRRLLIAMAGALILVTGLAILSFFLYQQAEVQRKEAIQQRNRANQAAQIAQAGRVAVQALLELSEQRVDVALRLSLQALDIYDIPEARSSLLTSIQSVPQLVTMIQDYTADVRAITYLDDSRFAVAYADGALRIYDAITYDFLATASHGDSLWALAYANDVLASAGEDGVIRLWNSNTELVTELGEFPDIVFSLAFHPDGNLLAAGYEDGTIRIWDVESGEISTEITGHQDSVYSLAFSHDGTLLASGEVLSGLIILWDVPDFTEKLRLEGHRNTVWSLDFSADDALLASGSVDTTVRLWRIEDGASIGQPLTDHANWVRRVIFSPDGRFLASADSDGLIILREADTGQRLTDMPPLVGHSDEIYDLAFSMDGSHLISGGEDEQVLVWDVWERQPLNRIVAEHDDEVYAAIYTADGHVLSAGGDGRAVLWDAETGEIRHVIAELDGHMMSLAASEQYYAVGGQDGSITLWDIATDQQTIIIPAHEGTILALAFNQDGTILASAGSDTIIKLWNPATGDFIGELTAHQNWVNALAFDGNLLAAGDDDNRIILWDVMSQSMVRELPLVHTSRVTSLAFSHDGAWLASGSYDRQVMLWDLATDEASPLIGHTNYVLSVAFSPDDTVLASGSRDGTIILWDVGSNQRIGLPLSGHGVWNVDAMREPIRRSEWVRSIAFNNDGTRLLSVGREDQTIREWQVGLDVWVERACMLIRECE